MEPAIRAAWTRHAGASPQAAAVLGSLLARYAEAHRHYHGVAHLEHVVGGCVRLLGGHPGADVADPGAVVLAAFFHDAVYDPRSASNEADSAALAESELDHLGVTARRRAEVARLVLVTAPFAAPDGGDDPAADVLLDADLAVLGADTAGYARYVRQIRAEYGHLDDTSWRRGRAAVLDALLARPALYRTAMFRTNERRARANLGAELDALIRAAPGPGAARCPAQ